MSDHTPTPWNDVDNDDCTHPVFLDQQFGVSRVMSDADYAHAYRCVNSHAALLAACQAAESLLRKLGGKNHDPEYSELVAAIASATDNA